MNEIKIFENEQFGEVRTVVIDSEPYFVGKDIAKILGYRDTSDALKRHIDEEDKLTRCFTDSGQNRNMYVINESGLYSLILSSKMPQAKEFKRWVTSEVLPSIRKHGVYATEELLDNPDFLIKALQELKEERELNKKKDQIIGELKPKADYTDTILRSKSLVTITQIAKDYGFSGKKMNAILHDLKVQYKQSGQWLLYSEHQAKGYTHSNTIDIERKDGTKDVKMNTKWTQKGRLFLYDLLKKNEIFPIIEKENVA